MNNSKNIKEFKSEVHLSMKKMPGANVSTGKLYKEKDKLILYKLLTYRRNTLYSLHEARVTFISKLD